MGLERSKDGSGTLPLAQPSFLSSTSTIRLRGLPARYPPSGQVAHRKKNLPHSGSGGGPDTNAYLLIGPSPPQGWEGKISQLNCLY